jgi:hypothetical protein
VWAQRVAAAAISTKIQQSNCACGIDVKSIIPVVRPPKGIWKRFHVRTIKEKKPVPGPKTRNSISACDRLIEGIDLVGGAIQSCGFAAAPLLRDDFHRRILWAGCLCFLLSLLGCQFRCGGSLPIYLADALCFASGEVQERADILRYRRVEAACSFGSIRDALSNRIDCNRRGR